MKRRRRRRDEVLPELAQPEERVPRRLRVEGDLHQQLAVALRELDDPRLDEVVITRIQMTDDLQLAKVYVRGKVELADEPDVPKTLLRGLRAATGRLRAHVGRTLSLRYTPELRFRYDEGLDAARRVDELLAEIKADQGGDE